MKIHPHDFLLKDLILALRGESSFLRQHLSGCVSCRDRLANLALTRPEPESEVPARVLRWPGLVPQSRQAAPCCGTQELLESLIEQSTTQEGRDPVLEEKLARRALEITRHMEDRGEASEDLEDLRAQAWASIGNARRQRANLDGAEEALEKAFAHLGRSERKQETRVRLLRRLASLRSDQRRFADALRLLKQALAILPDDCEDQKAALLVKTAKIHEEAGDPDEAMPLLREALERLHANPGNPRLLLAARHNLVNCLCALGRFEEAQTSFEEALPLYEQFPDSWVQDRRVWMEARIVRGLGTPDQAEALFLKARDGFLAEGRHFDVALVSLDLASLYAEQRRIQDLTDVALEIFPVFSSRRIDREARATLALLEPLS